MGRLAGRHWRCTRRALDNQNFKKWLLYLSRIFGFPGTVSVRDVFSTNLNAHFLALDI